MPTYIPRNHCISYSEDVLSNVKPLIQNGINLGAAIVYDSTGVNQVGWVVFDLAHRDTELAGYNTGYAANPVQLCPIQNK